MTKTLTELWREGTLEQRYYYVKYFGNGQKPFVEIELKNFLLDLVKVKDRDKIEVLAPVPSYDEYKQLVSKTDELVTRCHQLEKKLEIATKALKDVAYLYIYTDKDLSTVANNALKEMEGVK